MGDIADLKKDIAASLYLSPCKIDELEARPFLQNMCVDPFLMMLERDGAIYYKGDVIHTNKSWARRNLKDRELDFRTKKQRELAGISDFKKSIYGF